MRRFLLLLLLAPLCASAADSTSPSISTGSYIQAALALALIVSLLLGMAWLARKVSGGKGFGQGGMKIIGGVALGPRERIVLLEVGSEWLVVGIVPGQIRTLHRLEKGVAGSPEAATASADKPFSQWLQTVTERRKHD